MVCSEMHGIRKYGKSTYLTERRTSFDVAAHHFATAIGHGRGERWRRVGERTRSTEACGAESNLGRSRFLAVFDLHSNSRLYQHNSVVVFSIHHARREKSASSMRSGNGYAAAYEEARMIVLQPLTSTPITEPVIPYAAGILSISIARIALPFIILREVFQS